MITERTPLTQNRPYDLEAGATHCRADDPAFAPEVARMLDAAAREIEAYAGLALLDQEITVTLPDDWQTRNHIYLPIGPVRRPAVFTVTIDGVVLDYCTVLPGLRAPLFLPSHAPSGRAMITYRAGYGATVADVPPDIVHAIYDQAAAFFDARGEGDGKTNGMSPHMARVAARYRGVML